MKKPVIPILQTYDDDSKGPLKSKTIYAAVINMVILYGFPNAEQWVMQHPLKYAAALSFLMVLLRLITEKRMKLFKR